MTTQLTISPRENRVIILQDPPESVSEGGILIPDASQRQETIGTVVACGPGKFYDLYDFGGTSEHAIERFIPMKTKTGDRVIYPKFAGADVVLEGVTYKVMTDDQIIATLDNDSQMVSFGRELYGVS